MYPLRLLARAVVAALLAFAVATGAGPPERGTAVPQAEPAPRLPLPAPRTRPVDPEPASEVVSSFTTRYEAGEPRVANIKRAAELLDGTIVLPGERFSLNAALGERTTARGFVPAPMISGGRLVDSVGGGISQVATTLYNAAFFAGLELVEHTPHSFYIDRYPLGREATVSWGGPELVFRNDWPALLRIRLRATDTAITVRFYSQRLGRRVEGEIEEPYAHAQPSTTYVTNAALAPGQRVVVQEAGQAGFTVEYTRRIYVGQTLLRAERFRTRYEPKNAIVEIGPARAG